jgi:transcriptional regulator with XRE-family HTH domain
MSHRPRPQHIPAKLLAIRQKLGLSQTGMLRLLGLKCCYTRISEFERGKRIPNLMVLLLYARAGQVSLESIVDDDIAFPDP